MINIIKRYQSEVLAKLIPYVSKVRLEELFVGSREYGNTIDMDFNCIPSYLYYPESSFYYDINQPIIHFTSRRVLYSIINDQALRLYQLNATSDLNEVKKVSSLLNINERSINSFKGKGYFASFCELDILDTDYELLFWRLYGDNTNGVAIQFKVENFDNSHYSIGKVFYDPRSIQIEEFNREHEKFIETIKINNLELTNVLNTFATFIKSESYKFEREIRLLFYDQNNERENEIANIDYGIDYRGCPVYYRKLSIRKSNEMYLKIEKIFLGPNNNPSQVSYFENELFKYWHKAKLGYPLVVGSSNINENIR